MLVFVVWLPQCRESMIQQVKTKKRRHWRFVQSPFTIFLNTSSFPKFLGSIDVLRNLPLNLSANAKVLLWFYFQQKRHSQNVVPIDSKKFSLVSAVFFLCCPHMYKTRWFLRHSTIFSHMSLTPQSGFFNAPNTHLAFGTAEDGVHSPFELCWTEKQEIRNKVLRRRSCCGQKHNCSRTAR